jgi:metal-dependent amidase/aminoacylase/carboxypeptidase family protein
VSSTGARLQEFAGYARAIYQAVQQQHPALMALTQELWYMAEPTGQEFNTSRRVQDFLADRGFNVRPGASGLPTAAIGVYGNGPLVVGLSVEVDALPIPLDGRPVNHACGHNVAAATTIASGLALQAIAEAAGLTVCMQIDPEEEGRGGKPKKLEAGDYDGMHLYMAPHMGGYNWTELPSIGNQPYEVRMVGAGSHDASARESGNPVKPGLDSFGERLKQLELGYNVEPGTLINQQAGPYCPGQANIVGAVGIQRIMVRNRNTEALSNDVMPKVARGAKFSAATFDLAAIGRRLAPMYAGPHTDPLLLELFVDVGNNDPGVNRTFQSTPSTAKPASTDNWNVAYAIPTIHPTLAIKEKEGPLALHSTDMAIAANPERNPDGIGRAIKEGGAAFALVVGRIAADPEVRAEFTARDFSAAETLGNGRPEWMSAFPGWENTEVLFEGVGVDPGLLTAAQEANSPTFAIPGL